MTRYTNREIVENDDDSYKDLMDSRGVQSFKHYRTYLFKRKFLENPYTVYRHVWKKGDRLYKLAYEYYGDMKWWWLIALWNYKPTDAHYKFGMLIEIPYPAQELYRDLTNG